MQVKISGVTIANKNDSKTHPEIFKLEIWNQLFQNPILVQ